MHVRHEQCAKWQEQEDRHWHFKASYPTGTDIRNRRESNACQTQGLQHNGTDVRNKTSWRQYLYIPLGQPSETGHRGMNNSTSRWDRRQRQDTVTSATPHPARTDVTNKTPWRQQLHIPPGQTSETRHRDISNSISRRKRHQKQDTVTSVTPHPAGTDVRNKTPWCQ